MATTITELEDRVIKIEKTINIILGVLEKNLSKEQLRALFLSNSNSIEDLTEEVDNIKERLTTLEKTFDM